MLAQLMPRLGGYRRRFLANRHDNLFMGSYASFDAARADAPPGKVVGYDHADAAALPYSPQIQGWDYPALFWIGLSMREGMTRIVDLGGHVGIKYYAFRRLLDYPGDLRWTVCDVPEVVRAGGALAQQRGVVAQLGFTTDLRDADGCELLYASGSLQYLPQSLPDLLAAMDRPPRRIVLNTTALHEERTLYTLNSIGVAVCPYRIQHQEQLFAQLRHAGYQRRDSWRNEGKPIAVPFVPGGNQAFYGGACFDRSA